MSEIANGSMLMDQALQQIQERFVAEMSDCFRAPPEELIGVSKDSADIRTMYISTEKSARRWLFLKRSVLMHRNILRFTRIIVPRLSMFSEGKLRCELFLNDLRLRNIVQAALEPIKDAPWFKHGLEYVDMSHDPGALYPDEYHPELAKARLLVR